MSDTRAQIAAVLAAHIPNHDYDGCRCGHERTGEPAWREHLATVLEPLANSPGFAALVTGQMLWVCEQAKHALVTGLGVAPGELLGYGVAQRTGDGYWHLTPFVDGDSDAAANHAGVIRHMNESFPTIVYDNQPPEFFTDITSVEIRRRAR